VLAPWVRLHWKETIAGNLVTGSFIVATATHAGDAAMSGHKNTKLSALYEVKKFRK